ncbi:MAG: phosphoenolpyruvate synthase, partial [Planctomycetes bacterium]|nr:phosphoenolpyruvate synthase [Planctomycetota bacterium]
IDASDPIARYDAQALRCEENTEACRRRLRNPLKRAAFDLLLRKARAGAAVRENLKSEAMRYIALARRILLELGSRLQQRGVVAEPDDVFFAERTELPALVRESADLRSLIRSRRDAYERNSLLAPPPIVVGNFDAAQAALPPDVPATRVLRGIAASPGRARGPARVILRATEDEYVRPGEILVAPFTDPGWTPYFVTAAGIVMNTGGLLSHGSIVAREYGLPSVVNVGPATDIIRTGQMLEVDGDRGE